MTPPPSPALAPPEPAALRACMSRFATGVTVVTYSGDDGPRGATMDSFTSVSAEPPLVLVSVARRARCRDRLAEGPFCVNILGAEQESLARLFAGAPEPVRPDWVHGVLALRLAHPLAWVECAPWRSYDGGDHTLVVGEVTGTFSTRQALYEYYFFGDPVRMAGAYVGSYDVEPYKARTRLFLERA